MPCEHYKDALIEAAASGADTASASPSDAKKAALRAHLAACDSCRAAFAEEQLLFTSIDAGLHTAANAELPASLLPRIRASLDEAVAPQRRWAKPLILATAGIAVALAVFLTVRPYHAKPEEQAGRIPLTSHQETPATVTHRDTAGSIAITASSHSNRPQIGPTSHSLHAAAHVQPEVLVPPDEREAFARFVATLQERGEAAVALLTPATHENREPASLEQLQIDRLEVKPLEGTETEDSDGAENIR
jgi:hypothetical protein